MCVSEFVSKNFGLREEEAIKLDGLNVAQIKEMRAHAEKHTFQTEVSRMMKLIINSLYKNKEVFIKNFVQKINIRKILWFRFSCVSLFRMLLMLWIKFVCSR